MRLQLEAAADRLLLLLLLTDIALLLPLVGELYDPALALVHSDDEVPSLASRFLLLKELWITGLLMELALRRLSYLYLSWAALFGFLLLDNGFHFNAQLGALLTADSSVGLFGLDNQRLGQLVATSVTGALFLFVLWGAHAFAQPQHKPLSLGLFGVVAVLASFGVLLDTLHVALEPSLLSAPLGTLAATGEMLAVSGALWLVLRLRTPARRDIAEAVGAGSKELAPSGLRIRDPLAARQLRDTH
jgi:hypothetical protein